LAAAAVAAAAGSVLAPSAVELDWGWSPGGSGRALRVGVLLEGTSSGVAERVRQLSSVLGGSALAVSEEPPSRWGQLPSPSTVIRVAFWVGKLAGVLEALAAAGESSGARVAVSGPAGAGMLYACLDPETEGEAAARFVTVLRGGLGSGGDPRGSVAVLAAGPGVLEALAALAALGDDGAYGALPGAALMRAIKDQFDPGHRMFPGRLMFA
jgi:glycolate oxidase FAD binding subunit